MNGHVADPASRGEALGRVVRDLLVAKYGRRGVPGVRRISADIALANDGETISHGHVHNILNGTADNLTDRTTRLLARFFGKPVSFFQPSDETGEHQDSVQALAARFATFDPAQMDAIRAAIQIVTEREERRAR
ncbi:hypothetical protein SAMN05421504_11121 [Amycolatopsis xylanica]|uniref:XRE family transcriptional regulator n=1 Tax=Amycolatopsis xylanica TaxID=589385 RepID=A0A1H3REF3_9PSEU|nr:hypothetical protein [Amycolatopsis xylanica]SDZ23651.1 hypothetical protein SAMN05421504_11121 [Amycolatopsis xylanica]